MPGKLALRFAVTRPQNRNCNDRLASVNRTRKNLFQKQSRPTIPFIGTGLFGAGSRELQIFSEFFTA
jgi:hypothetical protein